ncbi:hypothetical protein Aph02nite_50210 [Actinoplanes philippinensis]|uniref:DNA binding domain-containing protein, excisionase family n=1 Tax=Actinoplanes philippinensis TaxID=35752 RepID=A0A1I2IRX4_9ACTN|nr:helix-turn-helix domain-containing protein [Actinoplanes philippinensis]GIE79071.1 hypothetical protein Aph02nite_50210 [Actinoplanes philippinensis]SFF44470.1 DNA binding domain-containing protein, excisionase family [Actinoplanes philippinensis]
MKRALATPDEISTYLGVSLRTLETWRYRKTGPGWHTVGRHVRYRWEEVDRWLAEHAEQSAAA